METMPRMRGKFIVGIQSILSINIHTLIVMPLDALRVTSPSSSDRIIASIVGKAAFFPRIA